MQEQVKTIGFWSMRCQKRGDCWSERILFSIKFKEIGKDKEERFQEDWKSKQWEIFFNEGNFEEREGKWEIKREIEKVFEEK